MTDRDLMQQALEALRANDERLEIDRYPSDGLTRRSGRAAIAALRERLARQEPICGGCGGTIAQHTSLLHCRCDATRFCDDWPRCDPPCHIGKRSGAVPARQEQEPVGQLQEESYGRGQVMWFNKPPDQTMLYTAPQRREWVGLAKDELRQIQRDYFISDQARAIEAALKERNA